MNGKDNDVVSNKAHTRSKFSDWVYEQILRLIQRGEFPKNLKLPTESEFSQRFGVSRPVVRSALDRLRSEGYIRSQQGSGSFVVRGPEPGTLLYPPIRSVADLQRCYEFRTVLEGESAFLAAQRHGKDDLEAIEQTLKNVGFAITAQNPYLSSDLNFQFHRSVARATHNTFFVVSVEAIPNLIGLGNIGVRNAGLDDPFDRLQAVLSEHISIYEAIKKRDGERARAEMQAHIANARQHIFERQDLV